MAAPLLMDLIRRSTEYLTGKGLANARREVEWIFSETLGLTRLELYTRFDMPLDDSDVVRLRERITRRGKREPLAYVLGNQPFRSLRLTVNPAVLVPRPETEELIDAVLAAFPEGTPRLLDVGTGSGAIALALKQERPTWTVEGTDASAEALAVARGNAERLGLAVTFHHGNLASHLEGPYDGIVANLPYIAEDERPQCDPELAYEPASALFAGQDGLDLIRPLMADLRRIAPRGILWLEHGWKQSSAIIAEADRLGLSSTVIQDGAGHQRFTVLRP